MNLQVTHCTDDKQGGWVRLSFQVSAFLGVLGTVKQTKEKNPLVISGPQLMQHPRASVSSEQKCPSPQFSDSHTVPI